MESIVKNYKGMVTKIGFDFRLSGHDLDDFIQVVFIKVFKNLDKYNVELASTGTWIKRIAENTAIDFKRKQEKHNLRFERISEWGADNLYIYDTTFVFEFFDSCFQNIKELLNILSLKEREVITLKYYENYHLMDQSEILLFVFLIMKIKSDVFSDKNLFIVSIHY